MVSTFEAIFESHSFLTFDCVQMRRDDHLIMCILHGKTTVFEFFKLTQYDNRLDRTSLVLYLYCIQMPRLIPVVHCLASPTDPRKYTLCG